MDFQSMPPIELMGFLSLLYGNMGIAPAIKYSQSIRMKLSDSLNSPISSLNSMRSRDS